MRVEAVLSSRVLGQARMMRVQEFLEAEAPSQGQATDGPGADDDGVRFKVGLHLGALAVLCSRLRPLVRRSKGAASVGGG